MVAEAMWWLEELELKQALRFSFGLGLGKYCYPYFSGLRRLCVGGCGGYVVVVAEAMWWRLRRLCGGWRNWN